MKNLLAGAALVPFVLASVVSTAWAGARSLPTSTIDLFKFHDDRSNTGENHIYTVSTLSGRTVASLLVACGEDATRLDGPTQTSPNGSTRTLLIATDGSKTEATILREDPIIGQTDTGAPICLGQALLPVDVNVAPGAGIPAAAICQKGGDKNPNEAAIKEELAERVRQNPRHTVVFETIGEDGEIALDYFLPGRKGALHLDASCGADGSESLTSHNLPVRLGPPSILPFCDKNREPYALSVKARGVELVKAARHAEKAQYRKKRHDSSFKHNF